MQKKCRRCGVLFTPIDGSIYCDKCGGTAVVTMPDERPETAPGELSPETKIYTLRQAREKAGFAQNIIAKQLGMSQGSYNNMERGNYMSIDRFNKFSGIVNIPPEQIKCREPKPPVRPSCVTKHKNPAGFTPKTVPEVKQVVSDLVESVNRSRQSQINKGVLNMKEYRVTEDMLDNKNNTAQQTVCTCATYEEAFKLAAEYRKSLSTMLYVPSVHIVEKSINKN